MFTFKQMFLFSFDLFIFKHAKKLLLFLLIQTNLVFGTKSNI